MVLLLTITFMSIIAISVAAGKLPLVINTWTFLNATTAGEVAISFVPIGLLLWPCCGQLFLKMCTMILLTADSLFDSGRETSGYAGGQ